jgi:hypothetical protein
MQTEAMWCFQCGAAYEPDVAVCVECGVGLVPDEPLAPELVGDADEDQVAYELHAWSYESRRMLDQLLTGREIAHAWQGASMIVRADDEDAVDALVDEVEVATLPTLDPEQEHTVYEMAGWTAEQQTELSNRLGMSGVPHEFDVNGDLVVNAGDESAVDSMLDDIEANVEPLGERGGSADDADGDGDASERVDLDGLDVNDLLSTLFGAADRLRRNARDPQGVLGFLDHAPTLERLRTPFGFDRPAWDTVLEATRALHDLLEADDSDDDEVRDHAQRLRDLLFGLI